MGRKGGALAGLDLSLKLTDKQEATRLAAAQARLLHLRLHADLQAKGVRELQAEHVSLVDPGLVGSPGHPVSRGRPGGDEGCRAHDGQGRDPDGVPEHGPDRR